MKTAAQPPAPSLAARVDRLLAAVPDGAPALLSWLPVAALVALAPGLVLWPLVRARDLSYLVENRLSTEGRAELLAVLAVLAVPVIALYVRRIRRRAPGTSVAEAARALNADLAGVLALLAVPTLLAPGLEKSRPFFVLALALAAAFAVGVSYYRRPLSLGARWLPPLLVALAAGAYALHFAELSVIRHHALATRIFDLGIYESIFWHTANGNPLGANFARANTHLSAHFDPILIALAPLYAIWPRVETLLWLQAVWLAAGAIPAYLIGTRLAGGPWRGLAIALVWLLYPALHGANLYDFHSLTLAGPVILWLLACIELGWLRAYWVALAALLLVREDQSLLACFVGLYAIGSRKAPRHGAITIGVSILYLAIVKLFVMHDPGLLGTNSADSYGYAFYFKELIPYGAEGVAGMLASLVGNPLFALQVIFTEAKLLLLAQLFVPLLLLPLLAGWGRVLLVYGLAFMLLSSRSAAHSLHFQYPTLLYPFAIALVALALSRLRERRIAGLEPERLRGALAVALVVSSAVVAWKFGGIVPNAAFRAGYGKVPRVVTEAHRAERAWIREMVERIGPTATVSASDHPGAHVAARPFAQFFPRGLPADFVFVDRNGLDAKKRRTFDELERSGEYRRVASRGSLVLLERVKRE